MPTISITNTMIRNAIHGQNIHEGRLGPIGI
jgi:hypothetical protein